MEVYRRSSWLLLLFVEVQLFFVALQGVQGELDIQEGPSESECRPYIEKALKQLETGDAAIPSQDGGDSEEDIPTVEITTDDSDQPVGFGENEDDDSKNDSNESNEARREESDGESDEKNDQEDDTENDSRNDSNDDNGDEPEQATSDEVGVPQVTIDQILAEVPEPEVEPEPEIEGNAQETNTPVHETLGIAERLITINEDIATTLDKQDEDNDDANSKEEIKNLETGAGFNADDHSKEKEDANEPDASQSSESTEDAKDIPTPSIIIDNSKEDENEKSDADKNSGSDESSEKDKQEPVSKEVKGVSNDAESDDTSPVEELTENSEEVLVELRPRDHIDQLLKIDEDSSPTLKLVDRMSDIILRDLKKLYDNAIKPLEILYKYKDLSNRHYGDSEIFAKPLILFMGPWSGGKSSIINYLLGIEHTEHALHTGAEPSPAYFNILMYGEEPEVLDGTQLAADYTFSGLQKFGQGLEERLRGYKLPSKILEKVNVVEIPGILEVRKQVSRVFPFNDACQWFIDRADIIFLVYDPSKLDVGPETEAILDQLKGREHQTRIVLNKADQVKPEELMRVQGALIWNISPLMSSAQPPIIYTTSLWSKNYEAWAPVRLLQAQERAFLRDIRSAVDKRIDNKISSARRFAVRVRNHAKMVDCYLTTYYNHKSVFGNRKQISDEIINHPQDFHIYEGLSTLTNISRYDLPDPDVYRDFFRLNALYEFQQLSATCTYFRGCPINRLDIAIAYDLPELVGKHKKLIETAISEASKPPTHKS